MVWFQRFHVEGNCRKTQFKRSLRDWIVGPQRHCGRRREKCAAVSFLCPQQWASWEAWAAAARLRSATPPRPRSGSARPGVAMCRDSADARPPASFVAIAASPRCPFRITHVTTTTIYLAKKLFWEGHGVNLRSTSWALKPHRFVGTDWTLARAEHCDALFLYRIEVFILQNHILWRGTLLAHPQHTFEFFVCCNFSTYLLLLFFNPYNSPKYLE